MTQRSKKWADGPFALLKTPQFKTGQNDQIVLLATEMANVHNLLIRGLNSIVVQAPHVSRRDYKSFIGYSLIWHRFVEHHHRSEETSFFMVLQEKISPDVLAVSMAEHRTFHDGMERYHAFLTSLSGKEDQFEARALLDIIDSFSGSLYSHLTNEISALLDLRKLDQEKLIMATWAEGTKKGVSALTVADFVGMMPFGLFTHDITYEGGLHGYFPPIPWPVAWVMRYVASLWHSDWWRFAPCDKAGVPKELYAVGGN